MGSTSIQQSAAFGEIFMQQDNAGFAVLPCEFSSLNKVQIIVQDKLGRSLLTESVGVDETTTEVRLDVSKCKQGEHHAWVYFEDKVVLRNFCVEKAPKKGIFSRVAGFFS
jgi:hypothetical protein